MVCHCFAPRKNRGGKRAAEKEETETSCGREVHGRVRDLGYVSIACGRHMHGVHGDQMSFGFLVQFEKF